VRPADVSLLAHATTVVTNAPAGRQGRAHRAPHHPGHARDVLELRRSARASLYDLFQDGPRVLVPRHARLEVRERLDAQGKVVSAPGQRTWTRRWTSSGATMIQRGGGVLPLLLPRRYATSVAIGRALRAALPGLPVYLSSEVLPEIREFERTSTTAVCAYVGPILASYLERLARPSRARAARALCHGLIGRRLHGGEGVRMPAMAVESGPAPASIAASAVGRQRGCRTSLLRHGRHHREGQPHRATASQDHREYEVGGGTNARRWMHGTGHPIRVPVIDLAEVSAGGGSHRLDRSGRRRCAWDRSRAGASPGRCAMARAASSPPCTDADLVLGYLNPWRCWAAGCR
jgi:N-methylhydantoinase A